MFKVDNKNTRTKCEICSKLTIKTQELFTICSVSIVNVEQVNAGWAVQQCDSMQKNLDESSLIIFSLDKLNKVLFILTSFDYATCKIHWYNEPCSLYNLNFLF